MNVFEEAVIIIKSKEKSRPYGFYRPVVAAAAVTATTTTEKEGAEEQEQ